MSPTPFSAPALPSLSYRQVLDLYDEDRKSNPQFANTTLPEYAQQLNKLTRSQMFDAGMHPSMIKNLSVNLDRFADWTGAPEAAGQAFGTLGSLIGQEENFRAAGQGLPRAVINMAPMIAGTALAPFTGGTSAAAGIAATAGLSGADAYEKTGSAGQGLLAAGTAAVLPAVAGKVGQLGLGAAGATLRDSAGKLVGETLGQRLAGYGAAQAGAFGLMEGSHQLGHVASGQGIDTSSAHLIQNLVSQLPFLAMDAGTGAFRPHPQLEALKAQRTTAEQNAILAKRSAAGFETEFGGTATGDNAFASNISALFNQADAQQPAQLGKNFGQSALPSADAPLAYSPEVRNPLGQPRSTEPSSLPYFNPEVNTGFEPRPTGENAFAQNLQSLRDFVPAPLGEVRIPAQRTPAEPKLTSPTPELSPYILDQPIQRSGLVTSTDGLPYNPEYRFADTETLLGEPTEAAKKRAQMEQLRKASEGTSVPKYKSKGAQVEQPEPVVKPGESKKVELSKYEVEIPGRGKPNEVGSGRDPEARDLPDNVTLFDKVQTPAPVTKAVVEQVVAPVVQDPVPVSAIKKVKDAYEKVLKPQYGVHDIALDRLSDAALKESILREMNDGASPEEAVQMTVQSLKNVLEQAAETKKQSIISEDTKGKWAALKAKIQQNTNAMVDLSLLPDMIDAGLSLAKDLAKAGMLKLNEWRAKFLDEAAENGFEFDDTMLKRVELGVLERLGTAANDDVAYTKQRTSLAPAMEQLSHLDDSYNTMPEPQRAAYGISPLRKVARWRNDIVFGTQAYSKYAEVDGYLLQAAGNLQWRDGMWYDKEGRAYNDGSAKKYLKNAAKMGYQAAVKKEAGGTEDMTGKELSLGSLQTEKGGMKFVAEVKPTSDQSLIVDRLNDELPDGSAFEYEVQEVLSGNKPTGTARIVKRFKQTSSLDERFTRPEGEEAENPDLIRNDDGEFEATDPFEDVGDVLKELRAQSDQPAADVVAQHMADLFDRLTQRLDPFDATVQSMGKKMTGPLVARTKVVLEYLRDKRFGGVEGEINWTELLADFNSKLPDEWKFSDPKEANNWWNGNGKDFYREWFAKQPEIQALKAGNKIENVLEGMDVGSARSIRAKKLGKPAVADDPLSEHQKRPRLDAVAAKDVVGAPKISLSLEDFGRAYFARRGFTPETAQHYTDSLIRLQRVNAVFPQADQAVVMSTALPDGAVGAALDITQGSPTWKPLVLLSSAKGHEALAAVVLGHEGWHIVEQAYGRGLLSKQDMFVMDQMMDMAGKLTAQDRAQVLTQAASLLPKDSISPGMLDYAAQNEREFVATLAGVHATLAADRVGATGWRALKNELLYGDAAISRFVQTVFKASKTLAGAIKGMVAGGKSGLVESDFNAKWAEFDGKFAELARTPREIEQAVKQLMALDATSPENIKSAIDNGFAPELQRTGDQVLDDAFDVAYAKILPKGDKREIGKLAEFGMDFMQLAEVHPELKPLANELLAYQGLASDAARDAMSPFFTRDYVKGKVVLGEATKALKAVVASDSMRKALSDQILAEQTLQRFLTPDELAQVHTRNGLDTAARQHVQEVRTALANANKTVAEQIKNYGRWQIVHTAARLLMHGTDTPYRRALDAADRLVTGVLGSAGLQPLPPGVDPMQLIASVPAEFGIAVDKLTVTQMAVGELAQKYGNLHKQLTDRAWFVSEQRFGKYSATYTKQGEKLPGRVSAETRTELEQKVAQLQSDPGVSNIQRYDNSTTTTSGMNADVVAAFKEIGKTAVQKTLHLMSTEEAHAAEQAFTAFDTAVEKELAARGIGKYMQHRKLSPGREHLDMLENGMRYLSTVPYALTKTWLKGRSDVVMMDPQFQQNPSALSVGKQKIENMLATSAGWANKAREWTFTYYLGANLSSAMVELAQPMMAVPAQLTKDGASIGSGYKYLFDAYREVAGAYKHNKFSDPMIDQIIYKLENNGMLEQTTGYFFDHQDLNAINISRMSQGKPGMSLWEAGSNKVSHVASLMRSLYSRATGVSSRVTAVAAALRAKELIATNRLRPEEAYDYVTRILTLTAPGTAGRAGQPVGFYSGKWINRSAAGVLGTLQGFTMTMTSMFARMAKDAVQSRSLTGPASKAFMQLAATQLLAAGALGLPGVGTALTLANQAFPDLNIKGNLRKGIASLGGDDEELGQFFSDVSLRGLPTVLSGIDMSGRLSLSNMLGVSSYDGFKLGHLLGAPGGVINNLADAAVAARDGQFTKALEEASPTSIKNILKLYRNDGEVRDSRGNLLYQPNAAEQVAMAVGFTPKRLSDMREFDQIARQQDESQRNALSSLYSEVSERLISKDFSGARAMLLEYERAHPGEFNAAEGLKASIQLMQNKTMPEDPRRGGSKMGANDREELLRTYGIAGPAPSETQRVQQAAQMQQQFGLFGGLDQNEMVRAQLVDQIMMKNPSITRAQARDQVEKMFRRKPEQSLR